MVRFAVTVERPNGTRLTKEFLCPGERRKWINNLASIIPEAFVVNYQDNVYLDDDDDVPPEGEEQWYEVGKKGGQH